MFSFVLFFLKKNNVFLIFFFFQIQINKIKFKAEKYFNATSTSCVLFGCSQEIAQTLCGLSAEGNKCMNNGAVAECICGNENYEGVVSWIFIYLFYFFF